MTVNELRQVQGETNLDDFLRCVARRCLIPHYCMLTHTVQQAAARGDGESPGRGEAQEACADRGAQALGRPPRQVLSQAPEDEARGGRPSRLG